MREWTVKGGLKGSELLVFVSAIPLRKSKYDAQTDNSHVVDRSGYSRECCGTCHIGFWKEFSGRACESDNEGAAGIHHLS